VRRRRRGSLSPTLQEQNRNKTAIRDARAGTVGRGPNRDKTAICRTLIGPQSPSAGPSDDDEEEVCRPCLQPTSADYIRTTVGLVRGLFVCSYRCLFLCSFVLLLTRSLRLFVSLPIFMFLCIVIKLFICSITLAGEEDRAAAAPAPAPASPAPERRRCWPSTRQQRQRGRLRRGPPASQQ